ncbi:MAG: MaoC/PaaZ C-terminal domain-containing protein [Myxococcales bacterium]|nr:acyl dehydratase [Myxococcales bacterium]HIK84638.1 acyl dehydratase [Myxococcales bacterium]
MRETLQTRELAVGQALPDLDLPITSTLIVGGALASRDYTPVHHDKASAVSQGLPDIFMNILTTQGICSRYVTQWAGPNVFVTRVQTKLGGPNMAGDTLKLRGKICSIDGDVADIEVTGTNAWGNHVTAIFTIRLP